MPASLLTELAPESAERLRAFVRGANMRVEGLTTQLVHLVDVHVSDVCVCVCVCTCEKLCVKLNSPFGLQ